MDENPIHAAEHICDNLIPNNVYVVIASHPPSHYDMSPMAVSFTCGFYKIPVIGISSRDSVFSDKVSFCIFSICDNIIHNIPNFFYISYMYIFISAQGTIKLTFSDTPSHKKRLEF